jgi:GDP/UDP-N,N'-diacetylbacillosamine 2-epimerase (hydrolysing)
MEEIKEDSKLTLQVIATGMHLSPTFGFTLNEIEADGFEIDYKVGALSDDDSSIGIAESMSNALVECAKAFNVLKPDVVVVLGDRFEIFAAASAALVARIPLAHIHGGETTVGAIDEALRHSITKMSQLHFVAAKEYRDRVIQLGESPNSVYLVGGLGIDSIKKLNLLSREELESSLGFKFDKKNLLVTFHPVTLENETAEYQITELLNALSELEETRLIFTMSNADTGGEKINNLIENYVSKNPNAIAFTSLGSLRYLSCMKQVDGVIGNSSSGIIEAPSFKKGAINIGDRQLGRLMASCIISCQPTKEEIRVALSKLYSNEFQSELIKTINLYGDGGASHQVVEILRKVSLSGVVKKTFHDIQFVNEFK